MLSHKTLFVICCVNLLLVFSFVSCESSSESEVSPDDSRMTLDDAVKICNKTFVIPEAWLHEFNNSGSFPDEFKNEPKCFLNCMYIELGISPKESSNPYPPFNLELADHYFGSLRSERLPDMAKIVENCQKQAEDDDDKAEPCEYPYVFGKCIAEEISRRLRTNIIAEV